MPVISVIVPVYKVEPYLRRCVDSILAQTFTDFELILVDDGSPDGCPAICDEYAEKDSRVRVIHQQNGGLSAARNAGLDWAFANSDSEWLTFIDSDDWVHPEYLDLLHGAAIAHNASISVCGIQWVNENTVCERTQNFSGERVFSGKECCAFIYTGCGRNASYVSSCTKLFSKELFRNIRFPKGKLHEDQFTTYRLLYQAAYVAESGECAYYYFSNEQSITKSKFNSRRYDDILACEEATRFYQEKNEQSLVDLCAAHKQYLIALYSIMARKAGIYRSVPSAYKMSLAQAYNIIVDAKGLDFGEYMFCQYSPRYGKLRAYMRKIGTFGSFMFGKKG